MRPNLINWLRYYRSELGVGYHDNVKRGEFLYRSENCRKLSAEERERINLIVKSVEDDFPLDIDVSHSEIVFPAFEHERQTGPRVAPPQTISFAPERIPALAPQPAVVFPPVTPSKPLPRKETVIPQAWNPVPTQTAMSQENLRFSSPHVFQAEKEVHKMMPTPPMSRAERVSDTQGESNTRPMPGVSPQNLAERVRAFQNPPLAPRRAPDTVPQVQPVRHANPSASFNRFNIVPMNYPDEESNGKEGINGMIEKK